MAQQLPICQGNPPLASSCATSCIRCDLNGFTNTTVMGQPGIAPPDFCTFVVHTIGWVGFVAGSEDLGISVEVFPCVSGNSIEMGIYSAPNCASTELVSNCNTAMFQNTTYFFNNTVPLSPGCVYFLVFDNNGPASCPFEVNVVSGSATAPVLQSPPAPVGPTAVCPGATVTYTIPEQFGACEYIWNAPAGSLVNGLAPPVRVQGEAGASVDITFGAFGGNVCVQAVNPCSQPAAACLPVTVAPIPPTVLPPVSICNGEALEWIDGNLYASSQTLSVTLPSWLGCDSIVRQQLTVRPPIITNLGTIVRCEGDCVEQGDQSFCAPGFYQATLESYLGCDSNVVFSLLSLPIQAVIAAPDTLRCSDSLIVLDGSGSTGGATFQWFNAQQELIGSAPAQPVSSTGQYTLVVTKINGSTTCRDTATVSAPGNFLPPDATALGDTLDCLSTTAQLNGSSLTPGAEFLWSGPGIDSLNQNLEDPTVSLSGSYLLVVTNPNNGCTAADTTVVATNADSPIISVQGIAALTCSNLSVTVSANVQPSDAIVQWSGPSQYTQSGASAPISTPGIYQVSAQSDNGCVSVVNFTVPQDTAPPVITASADTLRCDAPIGTIRGNGSGDSPAFSWSGPAGFLVSDSIAWVQMPGLYTLHAIAANGCTAEISVEVAADLDPLAISASVDGTITCADTSVLISAGSPDTTVQFSWSGPGGFVAPGLAQSVQVPGNYTVIGIAENGCRDTLLLMVPEDTAMPDLAVQTGNLDCAHPTALLQAASQAPGVLYFWEGPGGFSSSASNPIVSLAGNYFVTVTGENGCTATGLAAVIADYAQPVLSLVGADQLNCLDTSVLLIAGVAPVGSGIAWTGPGGFAATGTQVEISTPGQYHATATGPNGCTASVQWSVSGDFTPPDIQAAGGTLDCSGSGVLLIGESATLGASFQWAGPGGFFFSGPTVLVQVPGDYLLTVTAPNGCTAQASSFVQPDQNVPDVLVLVGNTLTCASPFSILTAQSAVPGVSFLWTGPGGIIGAGASIQVSQPGAYTVIATSPNGCTSAAAALLPADLSPPNISATGSVLDCAHPAQTILGLSNTPGVQYFWIGPGGFQSNLPQPTVFQPGLYTLTATGANGCTAQDTALVTADLATPVLMVSPPDTLNCSRPQTLASAGVSPAGTQIQWSGPGGFTASGPLATISRPGAYWVVATALNGCRDSVLISVALDTLAPSLAVLGDTLNCLLPEGLLRALSNTAGLTYFWSGPGNFSAVSPNPAIQLPGAYTVTATAPNGCQSSQVALVVSDILAPVVSASGGLLRCAVPQTVISASTPSVGASFSWSGPFGYSSTLQSPGVTEPGQYTVTITGINGCSAVAQAEVLADTASPVIQLLAAGLRCRDTLAPVRADVSPTGSVLAWSGPQAGLPPAPEISVSLPGVYTLLATAGNGCTAEESVVVEAILPDWAIDLGADTLVFEDTWVTIYLQTDISLSALASLRWTPTFGCYDCPRQVFRAQDTTLVRVRAEDRDGCVQEDSVTVFTRPRGAIYVPNVFSPDDDGLNDGLRIYPGAGIQRVAHFSIYDRWGGQVFLAEDYFPDDLTGVWDGRFRGERLQPAIFVWVAEVVGADGLLQRYTGDVWLKR